MLKEEIQLMIDIITGEHDASKIGIETRLMLAFLMTNTVAGAQPLSKETFINRVFENCSMLGDAERLERVCKKNPNFVVA
jgi:hypothetical protein